MATPYNYPTHTAPPKQKGSGLAVTALVLGLVALVLCWIPILNQLGIIIGLIGLVFGVIGIFKSSRSMAIAGTVISFVAIVLSFIFTSVFVDAIDGASADSSSTTVGQVDAADNDPMTDGGWTVSDVQISENQFGDNVVARITNNEDSTRSGAFTLTIFKDGQVVGSADGFVNDVEPGSTSTVDFMQFEQIPDGPHTFELQTDW